MLFSLALASISKCCRRNSEHFDRPQLITISKECIYQFTNFGTINHEPFTLEALTRSMASIGRLSAVLEKSKSEKTNLSLVKAVIYSELKNVLP